MNKQNFLNYIDQVAKQYSLSIDKVTEFLKDSFAVNFLKEYPDSSVGINIDYKKCIIDMWKNLTIVKEDYYYGEGLEDDQTIITLKKIPEELNQKNNLKVGDIVKLPINIYDFEMRLVKNILNHFQKLTLAEMNEKIYNNWIKYKGVVLEGVVEKVIENKDQTPKEIIVSIMTPDKKTMTKGVLMRHDLVFSESKFGNLIFEQLIPGNIYYFYVKDVIENASNCPILLSRTHAEIVKFLMKQYISEINDGLIEIKEIARLSGVKTKILVYSNRKNLDPVGCCIGPKGRRLFNVSNKLLNEKIDVILWSENIVKNIINSFVPAKVLGYKIDGEKEITLILTVENLLSAIGKKGVNAKLVYMLTGWVINLKTIQEAKDLKIDYQSIDDNLNYKGSNLSNRIYQMHYRKNEDLLSEIKTENNESKE